MKNDHLPTRDYLCPVQDLKDVIAKFSGWLEKAGYASYDPYDIWGTCYGQWARRLYYKKKPLGFALTGPLILMEMFCPSLRSLFVKKERYATCDAQLILAFLNLSEIRLEPSSATWMAKARKLAEEVLDYSIRGYRGYCWGYPFDWENVNGVIEKGTPHIASTPYCFEAFLGLFDRTGESEYLTVAHSIADFILNDLRDSPAGDENAMAGSYTPYDNSKVINASAYRAFVLFEAAHRFGDQKYADKALNNLRFILQSQRRDGSWLYAVDNPAEAFIDHFHTCFVLKNLHKINVRLKDEVVRQAIESGYVYYRRDLFDQEGLPKSFAIQPRTQISHLELYNVAEAITLGVLLRDYLPDAFVMANTLASLCSSRLQLPEGFFVTREYVGGLKHKVPFLRWAQAQLFYALTNLLAARKGAP